MRATPGSSPSSLRTLVRKNMLLKGGREGRVELRFIVALRHTSTTSSCFVQGVKGVEVDEVMSLAKEDLRALG